MDGGAALSVREASDLLGVSPQRVRQMIGGGQLPARRTTAGWLVPRESVVRRADTAASGRPVQARTVWAAIAYLAAVEEESRAEPSQVSVSDRRLRHRVRRLLRNLPDPAEDVRPWRRLFAARGSQRWMRVHPGVLDRLLAEPAVLLGGAPAARKTGISLAGGSGTHVIYVAADHADALIHRYRMRDDRSGPVHLVVVPSGLLPQAPPEGARVVPTPAAAADLLEEDGPRARHAAVRLLGSLWRAATDAAAMELPPSDRLRK